MDALGHKTPLMTMRYGVLTDEERRREFARADIAGGVKFPDTKRRRLPGRAEIEETLTEEGASLSEIARKLFSRE
jgi:hypothetical protein